MISENGWNIRICADGRKENTEVTNAIVVRESEKRQADDAETSIEDDNWATDMPFVCKVRLRVHDNASCYIRGSNEALGLCKGKLHSIAKDDWQEVGNGVGVGGSQHKEPSECPNLQISGVCKIGLDAKGGGQRIGSVFFDACYNKSAFLRGEEAPGFGGKFGKVNDEKIACNSGDACE